MNKKILLCLVFGLTWSLSYADTVVLKSGKQFEGEILQQTDDKVVLNYRGTSVNFYTDEISSISKSAVRSDTPQANTGSSKASSAYSTKANSKEQKPRGLSSSADVTPAQMQEIFMLAAQMNIFRLSAGAMANRAVEVWAIKEFQEKWKNEVVSVFPDEASMDQLRDFFSSAVVLFGRSSGGSAVCAFYSPWSDAIFLVTLKAGQKHASLMDFRFISGESWRGEPVVTEGGLKLYSLKEPLIIALARQYSKTIEIFDELYPPTGEFIFLPDAMKSRIGSTADELGKITKRTSYRMGMIKRLFAKENLPVIYVIKNLRALLPAGDIKKLSAYLSPRQNKEMLETICSMPAGLRQNLSPNYFVQNKSNGSFLVALVNAEIPRWVFAVQIIEKGEGVAPEVTIEAMDLQISAKILK